MSWNYRIAKDPDGCGYHLHEVYYGGDGAVRSWSPPLVISDKPDFSDFIELLEGAAKKPLFEYPDRGE